MRRLDLVAGFLLAGVVAAMAAPVWDAKDGVIIPPDKTERFLRQCSRPSPQNVIGFWLPNSGQVADIEARLPSILEAALSTQRHPPVQHYWRQYAGLVVKNRRIIYVNGMVAPSDPAATKWLRVQWQTEPIINCDGGNDFFGVEYDPVANTFAGLAFNGTV